MYANKLRRFVFNLIDDTIFQTKPGSYWIRICRAEKAVLGVLLRITAFLSTPFFGYYAPERRGEICLQTSVIGKTYSVDFAVGVTAEYGKNCWKC